MRETVGVEQSKQDPHAPRQRANEHAVLDIFLGKWTIVGTNAAVQGKKPEAVHGQREYVRVPGAFFVEGHFTHEAETGTHTGVTVMGRNEGSEGWFVHNYDNLGFAREYSVTMKGRSWTLTGRYERATCDFAEDGNVFTERWEISDDGVAWRPLCEMRGVRMRD